MSSKHDNSSHNDDQNDNDADLFRTSMRGVRPLVAPKRIERPRTPPRPEPLQTQREHKKVLQESLIIDDPDPGNDAASWLKPGIQQRILRKMQRGQYRMDAELDLHGLTATAAQAEVQSFLNKADRFDAQCVRIVHGKGLGSGNRGPVLKRKLGGWLRRRANVLAYCGARPADGGSGATYVLLQRKKK